MVAMEWDDIYIFVVYNAVERSRGADRISQTTHHEYYMKTGSVIIHSTKSQPTVLYVVLMHAHVGYGGVFEAFRIHHGVECMKLYTRNRMIGEPKMNRSVPFHSIKIDELINTL